jgi:hypothetical protein
VGCSPTPRQPLVVRLMLGGAAAPRGRPRAITALGLREKETTTTPTLVRPELRTGPIPVLVLCPLARGRRSSTPILGEPTSRREPLGCGFVLVDPTRRVPLPVIRMPNSISTPFVDRVVHRCVRTEHRRYPERVGSLQVHPSSAIRLPFSATHHLPGSPGNSAGR